MARLQRILAFPMAATAAGCLWLLYRLGGQEALLAGVGWTALVSMLLIALGIGQRAGRGIGAFVTAILVVVGIFAVFTAPAPKPAFSRSIAGADGWSVA